jgi:3-oxoacyl-[acyl-carrier-protein] synthase II
MTAIIANRPVISAWSAVSPFGIGRAAHSAGRVADEQPPTVLDKNEWRVPDESAYLARDFDTRVVLGKKGTRSMDRLTGLAVTAVRELLDDPATDRAAATGPGAGLVLGTTTGSAQSLMDFTRDSFTEEKPYFVETARFPNAVMNCAAAQCAIWHQLRGPNATVAGGRVAGLYALNYARRLLAAGRARTVLCGGAEEYSPARSWLEHYARQSGEPVSVLGEGCTMLLIEPPESADERGAGLAEVLSVDFGVFVEGSLREQLAARLRRMLKRANATPDDVWAISPSGASGSAGDAEWGALHDVFRGDATKIATTAGLGDLGAATASFQLVTVLDLAQRTPEARGNLAVVTAVDRTGVFGAALVRIR